MTNILVAFANRELKAKPSDWLCLFWIVCFLSGCATARSLPPLDPVDKQAVLSQPQIPNSPQEATVPPAVPEEAADGIIFGKADFRGVLKVEYVKLNIIDEGDPQKQYELLFGDMDENNDPTWVARVLEPHYFFSELPAGHYRITSISIPVGTTLATESADIAFDVEKGTVIYLGTLRVIGTDQKIRFAGVPLIRPGFAYRVEIVNEREEAVRVFRNKYSNIRADIQVKLMKAIRIQSF